VSSTNCWRSGRARTSRDQQRFLFQFCISTLNIVLNLALAGRFGATGAGVALLCTELFGMVIETWWLRRRSRYRTPVMLLLRAMLPTATNFAVARLVSGHHVVVIVTAVAYL